MKATKIKYQKCFNLGNYENEVIGIELEIEDGEKASKVLSNAIDFVNTGKKAIVLEEKFKNNVAIIESKNNYNYKQVMDAQEEIKEYESFLEEDDDLPF